MHSPLTMAPPRPAPGALIQIKPRRAVLAHTGRAGRAAMTATTDFAADLPRIRSVPFDAPWGWLAAGWRDLWNCPHISLGYGAFFALGALVIVGGLTSLGGLALVLPLAGGFLLVAPILAAGLYETSRRIERGESFSASDIVRAGLRAPGQLAFLGVFLLIAYLAWLMIALLLFMLFIGPGGVPPLAEFVPTLLFSARGLGLLVVGTAVGGVIAFTVFAATAVSVPLLMVREIDVATAALTSLRAVERNRQAMLLWAALIAGIMALGLATLFIGLVVAFPLIGHATWHAFREVVEA
jgi:uncharacterized membrane protein